jgi:hypothetical protein
LLAHDPQGSSPRACFVRKTAFPPSLSKSEGRLFRDHALGSGDGEDGEVLLGYLLDASSNAAEVLEFSKATFDKMPLSIEMGGERMLASS